MLALAVDIASPFIWAGAVAIVAGVAWVLRTAGTAGIGDIAKEEMQPEIDRIWEAIRELRRR